MVGKLFAGTPSPSIRQEAYTQAKCVIWLPIANQAALWWTWGVQAGRYEPGVYKQRYEPGMYKQEEAQGTPSASSYIMGS